MHGRRRWRVKVSTRVEVSTWQAFWQTAIEGKRGEVVAQALGMSLGAVYMAKNRVMARLRKAIDEIAPCSRRPGARACINSITVIRRLVETARNVFYGEGKRGGVSPNSTENLVCHNTFVGPAYAVAFHHGKAGNRVLNNIVQDATKSFLVWPAKALPQTLGSNLHDNSTAAPRWERDGVAFRAVLACQQAAAKTHSRYADPKLAGPADAHLPSGSPAIDGVPLSKKSPSTSMALPAPRTPPATSGRMNSKPRRSSIRIREDVTTGNSPPSGQQRHAVAAEERPLAVGRSTDRATRRCSAVAGLRPSRAAGP